MDERQMARYYAGGRVGIGLLLLLFPRRMAKGLWGATAAGSPAVMFFSRLVGARDAIIGAGTLAALQQEGGSGASAGVRPWMSYGAAADAFDAVATLLAYRHLPKRKRFALLSMAAGGAATGGYLMTSMVDDA
ncbi:MAG TPA: hypothetical protein VM143_18360 [Acidimicrobiales bacterium]|nr:hypothetical protein [Acidimicrobiales bacterium]